MFLGACGSRSERGGVVESNGGGGVVWWPMVERRREVAGRVKGAARVL